MPLVYKTVMKSLTYTHIHLFALQVDNGVLTAIFEQVLIGGYTVIGQDLGEPVGAASVHQIRQEIHILGSEFVFVFQIHVDKVFLTYLSCNGIQLGIVVGDDGQDTG